MKSLAGLVYRHRKVLEPFLYRLLFGFTLWYLTESALLLFRERGVFLTLLWANALVEVYLAAVAIYAYETFIHPKNRWGHWLVILWLSALVLTVSLVLFRPAILASVSAAALVVKVAGVVILIWLTKEIRRLLRHEHDGLFT